MIRNRRLFSHAALAIITTVSFLLLKTTLFAARENNSSDPGAISKRILEKAGVRGGLVVHLGCADGRLTSALRANDSFTVQGLESDSEKVSAARNYIRSTESYGPVSVRQFDGPGLPYADNLVNLIVVEDGRAVDSKEIERVLAPHGAAVSLGKDGDVNLLFRKPYPAEIDEWTHYLHDAGNNAVAEDSRIGPPKHLQWKATPMWCRSHEFASSVQAMVSAKGRLFSVVDEGIIGQPRGVPTFWTLIARDAFNGKMLWRRPCSRINPHALLAVEDKVYVTLKNKGPLCILDAATGETLHTSTHTGAVNEIALCDDRLILAARLAGEDGKPHPYIVAAEPADGGIIWKKRVRSVEQNTMVAGDGRICYAAGGELVCLSLKDGEEQWRTEMKNSKSRYAVLYEGVVFMTGGSTRAFSLQDGRPLWTGPDGNPHARNPPGLFGADGLIWTAWDRVGPRSFVWQHQEEVRKGFDPLTGKVRREITAERLVTAGHHIRCYPPKATERYLLLNKRGVEFFDIHGQNHMRANWTRGACGFGMLPANGFLYTPPSQCFCYQGVLLSGLNALAAERQTGKSHPKPALVQGPVYETVTGRSRIKADPADWPTYRHDPQRSGSVERSLPVELDVIWETSLANPAMSPSGKSDEQQDLREYANGQLTPPVAANGRVFIAESDAHAVHAVSAENGTRLWTFTADGRVDSPPTIHDGLCIFGCTDGWVYCLNAEDGRLAWRFRAAPRECQICVKDQIESAWPVHGSVMVRDDKVYLTAGRSTYLDGGIYLYALEPHTGRVVHKTLFQNEEPDVSKYGGRPFDMEGSRSDILVAGQEDIYLYQNRFDARLNHKPMPRVTKLGDRVGEAHLAVTDGFLDKTWFNRTYWSYGKRWPGYYFTYRAPKSGQILVFDDEATYALKVYTERVGHSPEFKPGTGYQLVADRNTTEPVLDEMDIGAEKGRGFSRTELPIWVKKIPIRAHGMLLAGDHLYVAGAPDLEPGEEAYEAMIGKRNALFRIVATADGRMVNEFKLSEAPVFDGLIAAGERLYMSTMQGKLICFGKNK